MQDFIVSGYTFYVICSLIVEGRIDVVGCLRDNNGEARGLQKSVP